MVSIRKLVYHGFYQFVDIVYIWFRVYLLCFGVFLKSLRAYVCFGVMWKLWSILELKIKEIHSCSKTNQSRHSDRVCSDVVLGNARFLIFYYSHQTGLEFLVDLERKSKTPSELCVGTPLIS